MKTITSLILLAVAFNSINYADISTTAGVCLVGGSIKSDSDVVVEKYKRKDCPVCKGKGWYISGDGIAKVDCGYCEPEQQSNSHQSNKDDCSSCRTEIFKG